MTQSIESGNNPSEQSENPSSEQKKPVSSEGAPEAPREPEAGPEAAREPEVRAEGTDQITASHLSLENRNLFQRISERGRTIANGLYEGLQRVPGLNRIVGKLEIAYHQSLTDRQERRMLGLKGNLDRFDSKIGGLDRAKEELEAVIKDAQAQGHSASEAQLAINKIDRKREGLLGGRDRVQSRFEARDGRRKNYLAERDRVADRLIGRYNEKLGPMERELEILQTERDRVDLIVVVAKARHRERQERLDQTRERKGRIEENLRAGGVSSKREIRKIVKALEDTLAEGEERMRRENELLAKRETEIGKKIAAAERKANPYRDKKEEFVRVKERKSSLEIEVEPRTREKEAQEAEKKDSPQKKAKPEVEAGPEKEARERLKVGIYIDRWNAYLAKEAKQEVSRQAIGKEFLQETGLPLDFGLEPQEFKRILREYYKLKRIPRTVFDQHIDKFFETISPEKE